MSIPLAAILLLLAGSCSERAAPRTLLVPVYFYQGHSVGKASRPTGLQTSDDGGKTFRTAVWPELISNSVTVDGTGRYVYLACGNGVMVSTDGGRSYRLTGGWETTEVQRIAVDRRDPMRAFAATAYGVYATDDPTAAGNPWRKCEHGALFRYCTDVLQDAKDPDTIWVASDRGVFVTRDRGGSFETVWPDAPVRRLLADQDGRVHAASDGHGLVRFEGDRVRRVEGTPDTVFSIALDPTDPELIYCGSEEGLSVSRDRGGSWTHSKEGLSETFSVYGILPDPDIPGRILVCGNDGVFETLDGGSTWSRLGFENALVQDITFAVLADVPEAPVGDAPGALAIAEPDRRFAEHRPDADGAFDQRREQVLDYFRGLPAPDEGKWLGWFRGALAAKDGKADDALWAGVLAALDTPTHSMFFTMPLAGFYLHARDDMPEAVADRIREILTELPIYRGDTENHWVMHYAALLLAAETWPETPASRWYTGRSTQENYDEARGWLMEWSRLAATKGQGEFDSPNYLFMYVTPMFLLYDFAEEPAVKQMAGMALDLLLADYLVESLEGAYAGGHSRIIGAEVEKTRSNRVAALHHLFAGGIPGPLKIHGWAAFAALSSYRPPATFATIANTRAEPFVHTERKRVRNVIRFGEELSPPVHKYDYMTDRYCLGSLQGGILQPIQQHTWDVTWLGSAENSTFFTVHPSVSARELGMFFPEEVRDITRTIAAQKGTYVSPDKLVSASPHEQIFQHENVLLALYQVPEGERFPHVNLYWPDCLSKSEEGGWVFGRDGEFFLAFHTAAEGEWEAREGHRRFCCNAARTGFAVVVSSGDDFDSFRARVLAAPPPVLSGDGDAMSLTFGLPDGPVLRKVWGEGFGRLDAEPAPFPSKWLYRGPFITSRAGSGVVRLTAGGATRILDFGSLEIREER